MELWMGDTISYCKPPQGDVWYQCDDKTLTRLRTPVKTSTTYLLFYDSVHADIWDISSVPMVHILVVWLWSGGLMSTWYLWDGRCSVGEVEYWCSSCDVGWMMCPRWGTVSCGGDLDLSHYFPYPFWSHISQSALQLFPVLLLTPYFPMCPP